MGMDKVNVMSGCREALDKWAKAFDTESDEWQDMMVDRVYAQGWKDSRQALSSCSEIPNSLEPTKAKGADNAG